MNYWEKKKRIPRNNTEYKNIPQAEWGNTAIEPRVNVFNFVLISYHYHRYNQGLLKKP